MDSLLTNKGLKFKTDNDRIFGLDIVRIFLALLIFLFHSRIHVSCDYYKLNAFILNGHIVAMTAFYMLSGYCLVISSAHRSFERIEDIKLFYKKRIISIYPLYFVAGYLGVTILVLTHHQSLTDNVLLLPIELLGIQSFYNSLFAFSHNGGTWFISCLFFCYFLFPFLDLLLKQLKKKTVLVFILLIVFILSYSPFVTSHFDISDNYSNPFFRLLEFMSGMLLARINTDSSFKGKFLNLCRSWGVLIASSIMLVLGISLAAKYELYKFWIPICCFVFILLGAGHVRTPLFLPPSITHFLSKISFSFFLGQFLVWHPLKLIIEYYWCNPNNTVLIVVSFLACCVSAVFLHYAIERPVGNWLKTAMKI